MTGADIALVLLVLGLVGLTVWLFWPERQSAHQDTTTNGNHR